MNLVLHLFPFEDEVDSHYIRRAQPWFSFSNKQDRKHLTVSMESQVTLVDTSVYGSPVDVIYFSRDDMKNTQIHSSSGNLLYAVETNISANDRTVIYRSSTRDIVALIKYGDLRGDKILFRQAYSKKLKEWLHGSSGKWNDLLSV